MVKQSIVSRDNTLKYENPDYKEIRTFSIENIDKYLDKYDEMYIVDEYILKKKNKNKKSNINNLILVKNNNQTLLSDIYHDNQSLYKRICIFLEKITKYDITELYWRNRSLVFVENIIIKGKSTIKQLNTIKASIDDKEITDCIDDTINEINRIDLELSVTNDSIRKIFEAYFPVLISVLNEFSAIDKENTQYQTIRNNLLELFETINKTLHDIDIKSSNIEADITELNISLQNSIDDSKKGLK